MTEPLTRAKIFANCLAPLDAAGGSLSEVGDCLRSDWQLTGGLSEPRGGEARAAILGTITDAKNLIDTMKSHITQAIESLPTE